MSLTAAEVHKLKIAPTVEGVLPAVRERWSPRSYRDEQVSAEDVERVLEAARWTASAFNEQPWRYIVGHKGDSTHAKIAAMLMGFNQGWAAKAPVLILTLARARFSHDGSENPWALYDLGAANAQLSVQAAALGLGTHSMAGYDQAAARATFEIGEEYVMGATIALGRQGEPAALGNPQLLERETTPRSRRTLEELVLA